MLDHVFMSAPFYFSTSHKSGYDLLKSSEMFTSRVFHAKTPPPSGRNLAKSRGGFGGSRDNPFLALLRRYDVRILRFTHNYIKKHCIFIKIY